VKKALASGFVAVVFLCCFQIEQARALGMGLYVEGATGGATFSGNGNNDRDTDTDQHIGFGLNLDTAVAKDKLFNYRLKLGYESVDFGWDVGTVTAGWDCHSFVLDNTFGFAVLKRPVTRLWLGPQIRLASLNGTGKTSGNDLNGGGIGLGLVLGANFHVGPVVSLGLEAGYREMFYFIDLPDSNNNGFNTILDGHFFCALSVLFRMGDMYHGEE